LRNYFDIKNFISEKNCDKNVNSATQAHRGPLLTLHKYLSCFEFTPSSHHDQNVYSKKRFYELNKNLTSKEKKTLGSFIFSGLLQKNDEFNAKKLKELLFSIPLNKIQLLVICFIFFINSLK